MSPPIQGAVSDEDERRLSAPFWRDRCAPTTTTEEDGALAIRGPSAGVSGNAARDLAGPRCSHRFFLLNIDE